MNIDENQNKDKKFMKDNNDLNKGPEHQFVSV